VVPAARHDEAVELAVAAAAKYPTGDPTDPATRLGPLVSAGQRQRVYGYIARGEADGARLMVDGRVGQPDRGHFIGPTIFAGVDPSAVIAQEEIFGPVLSIISYVDEDDAIRIANGTVYGLSGAVWSADNDRAVAFARRLRTGQVTINGGAFNPLAPFGGYKQSGYGRELGPHGLAEFSQTKSLQLPRR
jgi:aldehyde dehydrogenase (NAD+)